MKPYLIDRPKKVTVSIPTSLHRKIHLLLLDPVRARTGYGNMSNLMTMLLNEWLKEQVEEFSDGSSNATSRLEGEGTEGRGITIGRIRDGDNSNQTDPPDSSPEEGSEGEKALDFT